MATKKITQLTAIATGTVVDTDILELSHDPAGTPVSRKISIAQIAVAGMLSGIADPEGNVTAEPNRLYYRQDTKSLFIKDTGTGNTGWIQLI